MLKELLIIMILIVYGLCMNIKHRSYREIDEDELEKPPEPEVLDITDPKVIKIIDPLAKYGAYMITLKRNQTVHNMTKPYEIRAILKATRQIGGGISYFMTVKLNDAEGWNQYLQCDFTIFQSLRKKISFKEYECVEDIESNKASSLNMIDALINQIRYLMLSLLSLIRQILEFIYFFKE